MLAEIDQQARTLPDEQAPWWPSRFGADDQIGTLNEITPAAIVAAARLVREGRVFDLGRVLDASVLVDAARHRGVARLQAGDVINVDELEAIMRAQGTPVGPGDAVLFHTV